MRIPKSYDEYHEFNPLARYIRRNLPPGFISRPLMIIALVVMLFTAWYWVENVSEPYFECYLPCEHPVTGRQITIFEQESRWYTEGRPLQEQYVEVLTILGLQFTGFMMVNYAYWGIRTRGGRL